MPETRAIYFVKMLHTNDRPLPENLVNSSIICDPVDGWVNNDGWFKVVEWLDESPSPVSPVGDAVAFELWMIEKEIYRIRDTDMYECADERYCAASPGQLYPLFVSQSPTGKQEGQDGWVSVEERLPDNGHVLGCMEDTDAIYICYYNQRKGFQVWGLGREQPITDMKIAFWAPLPDPPNKQ